MKGYSFLKYKKGDFPVTEKLSKRIFSLPMYPQLKNSEVLKVVKSLKEAI
jgi:dTDP-4-amino-4,6-dideoxygalactose transaminase